MSVANVTIHCHYYTTADAISCEALSKSLNIPETKFLYEKKNPKPLNNKIVTKLL